MILAIACNAVLLRQLVFVVLASCMLKLHECLTPQSKAFFRSWPFRLLFHLNVCQCSYSVSLI